MTSPAESVEFRGALRVRDGVQDGLSRRWSLVKLAVSAGTLTVRDRTIQVRHISDAPRRPTTREQWLSLGSEFMIFQVTTAEARLELGVIRGQEQDVLGRLQIARL